MATEKNTKHEEGVTVENLIIVPRRFYQEEKVAKWEDSFVTGQQHL
jgi:hypothetical protein